MAIGHPIGASGARILVDSPVRDAAAQCPSRHRRAVPRRRQRRRACRGALRLARSAKRRRSATRLSALRSCVDHERPVRSSAAWRRSAAPAPPAYTLFDSTAVGLATFFGTPVAGTILMAINYRRLGKAGQAAAAVVIGIVVTGLAVLLWNGPCHKARLSESPPLFSWGMKGAAQSIQGTAVAEHVREGGSLGSNWTAFGLGAGACVLFFAGIRRRIWARHARARFAGRDRDQGLRLLLLEPGFPGRRHRSRPSAENQGLLHRRGL